MGTGIVGHGVAVLLQELRKSLVPVLVDFTAAWCTPCVQLSPVIDELAVRNQGRLKVIRLNIDEALPLAASLRIEEPPTVILYIGGQEAERLTGVASRQSLERLVAPYL